MPKRFDLLLAVWVAFLCSSPAGAGADDGVRYYGRWDRREPGRALTVNGGSYVVARFNGRAVTARFDLSRNEKPVPTIAWRIDDEMVWRESEIAESVELAKDLPAGEHAVFLLVRGLDEHQPRWAEPLTASLTFLGFDLHGGTLVAPPAEPKLKIEFLGDSITEGVLVHSKQPGRDTWPWMTDALRAYPSQTALKLGAQWRQVGFGAVGVTRGGSGGVPPAPDAFDWFYEGCPRDGWQADVVIINHGTNDGAAPAATFRPVYRRYLGLIRKAYPEARIFALRPFNGAHADDIRAEVDQRAKGGDAGVFFLDTTGWLDRTDFTDRVHPNAGAGAKVADKLSQVIRQQAAVGSELEH